MRLKNTTNTQTSERTKNHTTHRRLFARNVTVSLPFLAFLALCSCLTKLSRMKKKAPLCVLLWSTPPHKKRNTRILMFATHQQLRFSSPVSTSVTTTTLRQKKSPLMRTISRGGVVHAVAMGTFFSLRFHFFFYRDVVIHLSG